MNISIVKLMFTWGDINQLIMEMSNKISIKDVNIKYDNGIVISGRVKGGMPLTVHGDDILYGSEGLQVHIKSVSMLVKMPDMLKRSFIKDFIVKQLGGDTIIYRHESGILVIPKDKLHSLFSFSYDDIKSVIVDSRGIAIEFCNVDPSTNSTAAMAAEYVDIKEAEEIEYIINENDVKTEEFDIDKATDYYDKLRLRIEGYIKSGMPKRLHYLTPYMLLLPDVLALLTRLFMDRRISAADRATVIAGLTYIISPIDIIPDLILPFGSIDDLSVGFFILDKLLLSVPEEILKDNFSGNEGVVSFIKSGYTYIKNIVPAVKMDKILGIFNEKFKKNKGLL